MILNVVETAIGQLVYDEDGALYQTRVRTTNGLDIFDADGVLAARESTVASGRYEDSAPLGDDDPDPPATGGGDTEMILQSKTVKLTHAQIIALPSTPILIVPAPGAGKWLVPVTCVFETDFRNGFYTFSNGDGNPPVQGDSDIVVTYQLNEENAFRPMAMYQVGSQDAARRSVVCPQYIQTTNPNSIADDQRLGYALDHIEETENKPWYVSADNTGNFGGGGVGNTLTVTVYYFVRTFSSLT